MIRPKKIIQLGEYDKRFEVLDEDLLWDVYERDNYKIIETAQNKEEKTAVVYFSSNGLYDVKQKHFNQKILEQDRYEWMKNRLVFADRHIFVRDIWQMSYYHGINSKIDSFDKLIEFLKEKTKGYKIITLGSSGGGYGASLVGSILGAERIFSFSGQFDVIGFSNACSGHDPILWAEDKEKDKYLQIEKIVGTTATPLYYFVGGKNKYDRNDLRIAKSLKNVRVFCFDNDKHGMPVNKHCLRELINMNNQKLEKLYDIFCAQMIGDAVFGLRIKGWTYLPIILLNLLKKTERKIRSWRKRVLGK